jgi:hypothetical protein
MITFKQLKGILCDNLTQQMKDDNIEQRYITVLENNFESADTLLDLIHIYEEMGYETYDANECIINTMMQLATFD